MIALDVCVDMPKVARAATMMRPEFPNTNQEYTNTSVVIIGGGISGMCMATELLTKKNVKNFIILEKSGGFGGTWRDNKFPGCCCDVWSVLYSYSFEQNPNWTREYPSQEEILDYLVDVAAKYKLYKYARFNTVAEEARWNDCTSKWETKVSVGAGKDSEFNSSYTITSDFLVAGTGQLNIPKGLSVPGFSSYTGKIMHSARWDWSYDLNDKRIAIVGTGATTAQIAPEVAKIASHLIICQRTPAWVIPRHDFNIPTWKRKLFTYLPPLHSRARAEAMDKREAFHNAVTQSTSPHAAWMRSANAELLRPQLAHRPDLWDVLTPQYSPGCKRTVISDDYYPCLGRKNVALQTSAIVAFTERGLRFADGTEEEFDLIVLATGFDTLSFLAPIKIFGRDGVPLHPQQKEKEGAVGNAIWPTPSSPHAHLGITVPNLPNFGILYGPNTNLSHNSLILVIEAQARYLTALISRVISSQGLAIEPRPNITDHWDAEVQGRLQGTSFADPGCNSWWKAPAAGEQGEGRIVNNWAGTAVEYQKLVERVRWRDFVVSDEKGKGRGTEDLDGVTWVGRVVEETRVTRVDIIIGVMVMGVLVALGMWI